MRGMGDVKGGIPLPVCTHALHADTQHWGQQQQQQQQHPGAERHAVMVVGIQEAGHVMC